MQTEINLPENLMEQLKKVQEIQKNLAQNAAGEPTNLTPGQPVQSDIQPPAQPAGENWKAKYDEMVIIKDAAERKILEISNQLGEFHTQLFRQKNEIDALQGKLAQAEASKQPQAQQQNETGFKKLNPEHFEAYGDEIVQLASGFNSLVDMFSQLKAQPPVQQQPAQAPQQTDFYKVCCNAIPDFFAIDHDNNFIEWLQHPNPYTGQKKHDVLLDAFNKADLATVRGIVDEYRSTGLFNKPSNVPAQQGQGNDLNPPNPVPQQKINTPPISPTPAASLDANFDPNQQGPRYKQSDVKAFFQKMAKGEFVGNEKWAEEKKADITRAYVQGRIIYGQ